jgi:LysR family transcriptional regulator, glycine cleavage system transcriptional activator
MPPKPPAAKSHAAVPRVPLPSLNALLAFEAAARHSSFTRAAAELGVTQTAVSHQVRALEHELGTALFHRSPQRISVTAEGQAWATELAVVFGRLRDANDRLRTARRSTRPVVSVSIIPSFGSRWLVPRLGRFLLSHADVDVRISATERLVDFALEPVDIGIRYGLGAYPGLVSTKLASDALVVVAAPALASKRKRWHARDLASETLIHDDYPDAWAHWFRARQRAVPVRARLSQLTDSAMLVEAAVRAQGVALARWSLASDELELGRLRLLFPDVAPLPTGHSYYLVSPRENLRRKVVSAFRDWVVAEATSLQILPRA